MSKPTITLPRRKPKYLFEDLLDGRYIYVSTDALNDSDEHLRLYVGDDGTLMKDLPVQGVRRLRNGAIMIQAGRSSLCFIENGPLVRTVHPRWHYGKMREAPLRALRPELFEITEDEKGTRVRMRT